MPELLDGDTFDVVLKREVTEQERNEAIVQFGPALTFYQHYAAGYFTISHAEYQEIPTVVFEGYGIYQQLLAQYRKMNSAEA